jgi:hypothetical protein
MLAFWNSLSQKEKANRSNSILIKLDFMHLISHVFNIGRELARNLNIESSKISARSSPDRGRNDWQDHLTDLIQR